MEECDAVIHMVGSITDAFNYKKVLEAINDPSKTKDCMAKALRDPASTILNPQKAFELANWLKEVTTVSADQSLETQNRDSVIQIASKFNQICENRDSLGTFVFLSAEESIISSQ